MLSPYRTRPDDDGVVVVCFDEMGPIGLIPPSRLRLGHREAPERLRASRRTAIAATVPAGPEAFA